MHLPEKWTNGYLLPTLAFLMLVGPFALDFHLHYPDEMYYTDAAIRMMQNGDYLTTYLGDGMLRFKKPILPYWFVLAGFNIFGVSALGSRIFFLLAGAAIIPLVYQIARLISDHKKLPVWSAWIAATHPVLIFSSTRSIPDILLALFMTCAALGVTGLIRYGETAPKKYHWLLYLGLGLAFEVKGLPAAALGLIAIAYVWINPWRPVPLKRLLYLPAMLSGVGIALFWFVAMYLKFGPVYLNSFFEDQVGMRVGSRVWLIVRHLVFALVLMMGLFFPWFLMGVKRIGKNSMAVFRENRAFIGFILVWVLSIVFMTALVSKFYERYLLPVTPLAAVSLAWILLKKWPDASPKRWTAWFWMFIGLNVLLLLVALFANIGLGSPVWVFVQWCAGLLMSLMLISGLRKGLPPLLLQGLSILLIFFNLSLVSHPLSIPHQGRQMQAFLDDHPIPPDSHIAFLGHVHYASKIRIGLGKAYQVKSFKRLEDIPDAYSFIICDQKNSENLPADAYHIQLASLNWDPKYVDKMIGAILNGSTEAEKLKWGKKYYWAEKIKQDESSNQ
ncbi:4-amino-4-deoxy-L-arabinose transferase [Cyclobacterium lianum]|uniref:4-amino-4-deoxy-L-arabinose transferase n=1 Tax=Cyclobacterium lianum TaxID=388280 RepID=A0A1M7PXA2_9BACT|nr:phospholipid carrier-dependent glycosyltransferase [Cyclobacterium lianum]SHN22268.1 4-amino-4-deoxy-L-arabinose transferase [Cyclobacterium lianum]